MSHFAIFTQWLRRNCRPNFAVPDGEIESAAGNRRMVSTYGLERQVGGRMNKAGCAFHSSAMVRMLFSSRSKKPSCCASGRDGVDDRMV
jgi:hypothetical protein